MNKCIKKIILISMFAFCYLSMLMTWYNASGVKVINGTSIVTGNMFLSVAIIVTYIVSVLFFDKSPKIFLISGILSLLVLLAQMLFKFYELGSIATMSVGPYVGFVLVIITLCVYIFANYKIKK